MLTIPLWVWLARNDRQENGLHRRDDPDPAGRARVCLHRRQVGTGGTLVLMALAGVGFSSHYVLPWAMAPDTIEYGYARSGVRREGIYYSVWTFVIALGGALAGFLVGQGLEPLRVRAGCGAVREFNSGHPPADRPAAGALDPARQPGPLLLPAQPEALRGSAGANPGDGSCKVLVSIKSKRSG